MIRCWLSLALFIFSATILQAQHADAERKNRAKQLFYEAQYAEAVELLSASKRLLQKDEESRFLAGICYYHLNKLEEAEKSFSSLLKDNKPAFAEVHLLLGKTYHARHEFDKVAHHYKEYLKLIKKDDPSRRLIVEDLRRIANGLHIQFREQKIVVENLGPGINTAADEFAPVLSPNYREKLYFSSIGYRAEATENNPIFSDIYQCSLDGGAWTSVSPLDNINYSETHEVLLDFNRTGSAMFYFKGNTLDKGEIMVDTFRTQDGRNSFSPFTGPLYAMSGDGTPYFANDTTLLFSSNRPGGYGGQDIYKSTLINGYWSKPENLGPEVNSGFDEISPFLSVNGKVLYYSSNDSQKSIGGFDIFKSTYENDEWTTPYNVGIPVNSAGDDAYFRLADDGYTAFFSSSRKDGIGKRDIYVAYFQDYQEEQNVPQPVSTPIIAQEEQQPKSEYEITREVASTPIEQMAETESLESLAIFFKEEQDLLNKNNKKVLDKIAAKHQEVPGMQIVITGFSNKDKRIGSRLFKAIKHSEQAKQYLIDHGVATEEIFIRSADLVQFVKKEKEEANAYSKLIFSLVNMQEPNEGLTKFVNIKSNSTAATDYNKVLSDRLFYKVQIASVQKPYLDKRFTQYPDAMMEKSTVEGYYRCTLGLFQNYQDANELKETLRASGYQSAFVVPYLYGIRLEKKEVRQYTEKFPDLEKYLRG